GKTPEICLYTFVELFIFKYLSDLGILTGNYSFDHLFSLYKKNNSAKDVLRHYAKIIRPKIKELFPESELDKTTIINGTIFVNEEQGKISIHYETVFEDVIKKFEKYGKLENIDHDFKIVRAVNQMVGEPKEGMKICDPACGVGKFPLEFIKDK
ncbi:13478_t:CDS:2, partial [Funneliformis geosporum]